MSANNAFSDSPSLWSGERLLEEYKAEKAKRADNSLWPFDRAMQPIESDEDLERVRAAGYMAASCMQQAIKQKAAMEKIAQDLNSSLSGFGVGGASPQGWMSLAQMEDPYAKWCKKALEMLLMAPGAPESWSTPLPGGGCALNFLPEGKPKAALVAYALTDRKLVGSETAGDEEKKPAIRAPKRRL